MNNINVIMLEPCYLNVLLLFFLIVKCYSSSSLKDHVVAQEYNVITKFNNVKKVDRGYDVEVENIEGRRALTDFYQNLQFYDDQREFLSSSWDIYTKTRGIKVYTVNRNRNSNICNHMRRYFNIPLIIEFPEKGLISFQYKTYLDIEKMDSFLAYINHLHPKYTISVAYLSKKYEYNEIEMIESSSTSINNLSNWKKIKYSLKVPQYKHSYKYLLIRNNGPYNLIFIGHSLFLPDDIMLYSDEGGVNTDYIYLIGTDLTNINRNGYYSITSLTSILNFSLVFNMYSDKPIINLNNFDGLSFYLIKSSSNIVRIEFSINTSIGDYLTTHTIAITNSVVSVMFDFRNFHGYNFLLADTDSLSFSIQSENPNCIFKIREIVGHIKYPTDRRFDYVFNRYSNKTFEPQYFEVEETSKYINNQCLVVSGKDPLANKRNLTKSIIYACICGAMIIFINMN